MTPEENYAEAERLADNVRDVHAKMTEVSSAFLADPLSFDGHEIEQVLLGGREQIVMATNRGMLHAKLAEVGLLLRQAESAGEYPIDPCRECGCTTAHKVGLTDDSERSHDFGRPAPDNFLHCRKCGRCERHQGAECVGGQENSTAKTCLLCVNESARGSAAFGV